MSLTHKIILKELVDHKLTKSNLESLNLIDDFARLEDNPHEKIDDDLTYTLKVVKLHNILQLQLLQDKMKQEHEQRLKEAELIEEYK